MLYFDSNHTSIEANINKKKGKQTGKNTLRNIIIGGITLLSLITFSGCSKDVPCNIHEAHAHYYTDDIFGRYIVSEKASVDGLDRSDKYVYVSKEDKELLKFINKNELFKISDNRDVIEDISSKLHDQLMYEYTYMYWTTVTHIHPNGNGGSSTSVDLEPRYGQKWIDDPNANKNYTGKEVMCHYVYIGYKIVKNEKGKYELIKSDYVENINDLPSGYDYIKRDFYRGVDSNNWNHVIVYGGDKDLIDEEEYEQTNGKSK